MISQKKWNLKKKCQKKFSELENFRTQWMSVSDNVRRRECQSLVNVSVRQCYFRQSQDLGNVSVR